MNEELKFFGKIYKKKMGGGGWEGGGSGGGSGWWAVRVDVNAMLGVRGDVGYGNQKYKVLYNVKKVMYNIKLKIECVGGRGNI